MTKSSVNKVRKYIFIPIIVLTALMVMGWGQNGHRIINSKSVQTFPSSLNHLLHWADSLGNHASDADYRKSTDPSESPKHYIDIDNYPEFVQNGYISQSFDSVVALHGLSFVMDQGTLPWTIITTMDSITAAFRRGDNQRAMLLSADLGHYVGDAHNPLHITKNYNGQLTGQSGVHSRYETTMINRYLAEIQYTNDSAVYISDVSDFVFRMLYENYVYVDSVLYADALAKVITGSTSSNAYYQNLWNLSKGFTIKLLKKASYQLGALIYTAWINAQPASIGGDEGYLLNPFRFNIYGTYPNPFNGRSVLKVASPILQEVKVSYFDISGRIVDNPRSFTLNTGENLIPLEFGNNRINSGIYIVRLTGVHNTETKKVVLLK